MLSSIQQNDLRYIDNLRKYLYSLPKAKDQKNNDDDYMVSFVTNAEWPHAFLITQLAMISEEKVMRKRANENSPKNRLLKCSASERKKKTSTYKFRNWWTKVHRKRNVSDCFTAQYQDKTTVKLRKTTVALMLQGNGPITRDPLRFVIVYLDTHTTCFMSSCEPNFLPYVI